MSYTDGEAAVFYVLVERIGSGVATRIDATDLITALEYEDTEKKSDKLTLTIDNWDLSNFDDPIWKPGNKVIATWGYPGHMAPARECIIQKVTGSTVLKVEAQSKAMLMNKQTQSKTYENTRRSEIVHAIAKDYGFGENARFIQDTEETHECIVQARATDAQFIKRLADLEGFEFYVAYDGLHWHERQMGQKPLRLLQYYLPPSVGDIVSFDVENDIFAKPKKVTKKGRDPLNKKDLAGEGSDGTTERDAAKPPEPGLLDSLFGDTGTQKPTAAPGTPVDPNAEGLPPGAAYVAEEKINEQGGELTDFTDFVPTTEVSPTQVKKEADGKFKRAVQATVKLTVEMVGDPGIFKGTVLDIQGISRRLSGLYYVNQVNHVVDSGGFKLKIKCSTDGTGGKSVNLLTEDKKKSKAKVNDKKPDPAKPEEVNPGMQPREEIAQDSGETRVVGYYPTDTK